MALKGAVETVRGEGFLAWWLEELRALAPARRVRRPGRRRSTVLFWEDGVVRVFEARRAGVAEIGSFLLEPPRKGAGRLPARLDELAPTTLSAALRGRRGILLRLSTAHGLVVRDLLPAEAEPELRAIVANRLDTLTPWTAERAAFDVEINDRRPDGRLEVTVAAVPRALLERIRERLLELGIEAERVDLGAADDPPVARFDLTGETARSSGSLVRLAAFALVGSLVLLGAALAGSEIHARSVVLGDRERAAVLLEARLADLDELRERLFALRREAVLVAQRLAAAPSVLSLLETLSRALPDDAFLSELELSGDRLRIAGFATNAAPLVPLLEELPALEDVRFQAPSSKTILEDPEFGRREVERFVLAARVVGLRGDLP
jgi:general secretion pathway protein L